MAIDPQKIMDWPFKAVEQSYTAKDTILYALGVGLGADPLDESQLDFVFEEAEFKALPTMAAVLAGPGFWARDPNSGLDWIKILHGEQGLRIHRPLPVAATVVATTKVTGLIDKGAEKGALIYLERTLADKTTGVALATLTSTSFARGDGGFDGPTGPVKPVHSIPDRDADEVCDLSTIPQAALIYRLSGDPNPLHVSPKVARAANFKAPILHGLCTLGIAGHAILRTMCNYDVNQFKSLDLRFSAPVYPGETIRTQMWRDGAIVSFRSLAVERDVVVLNNGRAEVVQ